jgi:citrate lyase beta subunit
MHFVTGTDEKRIYELLEHPGLDSLIFDLEELVPPELKDSARKLVCSVIESGVFQEKGIETVVRINPVNTYWYVDDILELVKVSPI